MPPGARWPRIAAQWRLRSSCPTTAPRTTTTRSRWRGCCWPAAPDCRWPTCATAGNTIHGARRSASLTLTAGKIKTISVAGDSNGAAQQTAASLAQALGAEVIAGGGNADLILVDSQSNAPDGKIVLGGSTRAQLDSARGSVIVLPRGAPLSL